MRTTFQNPANGQCVEVSDGNAFLWTALFGGFYFLARGHVRGFVVSFLAGLLTFGLSWFIFPFFAGRMLRSMYEGRGYSVVDSVEERSGIGLLVGGIAGLTAVILVVCVLLNRSPEAEPQESKETSSVTIVNPPDEKPAPEPIAPPSPVTPFDRAPEASSPPSPESEFISESEAKQAALRTYPELGIVGSRFNNAYVWRYNKYRRERPRYFENPDWPMTLARETAQQVH